MTPFKIKFNVGREVLIQQYDLVYNTMQGIKQSVPDMINAMQEIASNKTLNDYIKETYLNKRFLKEEPQIRLLPDLTVSPNRLFIEVYTVIYICIDILPDRTYVVYEPSVGAILYVKQSEVSEAIVVENEK